MVYEQVLALGDAINPQIREIMISRLSAAHFRFAKVFYRKKKYLSSLKKLFNAFFLNPLTFAKCLLESVDNRVLKHKRTSPNSVRQKNDSASTM